MYPAQRKTGRYVFRAVVIEFIRRDKFYLFNQDMIKHMEDGKVYADGKLIYEGGRFKGI